MQKKNRRENETIFLTNKNHHWILGKNVTQPPEQNLTLKKKF